MYTIGGELYHHGVLHQQWGVRNGPPYPLSSDVSTGKSLKDDGKKKSGGIKEYVKAKKKEKQRNKSLKKAREARKKNMEESKRQEAFKKEKDKVKESGNASEILKYKNEFSRDELMYAYQKIEWEQKLNQVANANKKSNWDKVDRAMRRIDQARDWIEKGTKFYNAIAKIYNAALDEDLPIVGGGNDGQNQQQKKKKKK